MRKKLTKLFCHETNMTEFHMMIESRRPEFDSYIETLTAWAEEQDIDASDIVHLLSPSIIQHIRDEAITLRLVKDDSPCLPF